MPRVGAKITQADLARALRAVKAAGMQKEAQVEARPDGTIVIAPLDGQGARIVSGQNTEPEREIVL
ncbi:hypothetical protein G3545_12175 [Starkeya sp. ORNL1]|uniref:hypothetical protein n=1 Tax=Starkeya sp. ORNL1 TaxID=2709380 RepID=UPI001462A283|nr:hypothetical protein [Starkeya sp. ORNL1]QJP14333.1 hypothetical protein G3545_12175 [Starkeya sp. ORNL1]